LSHFLLFIKLHYPEWTGIDTVLTAGAKFLAYQYDSILPLANSAYRAGIHTWWLTTVHAMGNYIPHLGFAFDFTRTIGVDSNPPLANRQIVLLLAGNLAGIATKTISGIDNKSILLGHYGSSSAGYILQSRTLKLVEPIATS
jgi:hypothetical protein